MKGYVKIYVGLGICGLLSVILGSISSTIGTGIYEVLGDCLIAIGAGAFMLVIPSITDVRQKNNKKKEVKALYLDDANINNIQKDKDISFSLNEEEIDVKKDIESRASYPFNSETSFNNRAVEELTSVESAYDSFVPKSDETDAGLENGRSLVKKMQIRK